MILHSMGIICSNSLMILTFEINIAVLRTYKYCGATHLDNPLFVAFATNITVLRTSISLVGPVLVIYWCRAPRYLQLRRTERINRGAEHHNNCSKEEPIGSTEVQSTEIWVAKLQLLRCYAPTNIAVLRTELIRIYICL